MVVRPGIPFGAVFEHVRKTRWTTIGLFLVAHTALLLFFFSRSFRALALPVHAATGGLVTPVLLSYVVELAVLVGGVMMALGGLRTADLGLIRSRLPNAFVILFTMWALVQLAAAALGQVGVWPVQVNQNLFQLDQPHVLGRPIQSVFGSAFVEELMYRGFLLPQLYLLSEPWWPRHPARGLAFAVAASQLLFGLGHYLAGVSAGLGGAQMLVYLLQVTLGGVFFAFIYLRTDNLFLAIGVHALLNNPMALFVPGVPPALLILVFSLVLMFLWPRLALWLDDVFTLRAALVERWRHPGGTR